MDTKTLTFHDTPKYFYIGSGDRFPIIRGFRGLHESVFICRTEEEAISCVADCNALAHHETETIEVNFSPSQKKKRKK